MRRRRTDVVLTLAVAGAVLGAPAARGVGGTVFDNDGMVYITYDSTHWSDGFPGLDFSLPTPPDGLRRELVRYSGWWVRDAQDTRERRLGNPSVELYDPPSVRAELTWACPPGLACASSERGWVFDDRGPVGSGVFVSELTVDNPTAEAATFDVFHYFDPLVYGQPDGHEHATFLRPNFIEFTTSPVVRRIQYRASGFPVSACGTDDYASAANLMVQLNDAAVTSFGQGLSGVNSALGVNCAMRWSLVLQPGESRVLRVSIAVGVDRRLTKGDFNLDAMPDLFFEDGPNGALRLWPMKGSARLVAPIDLPATPGFRVVGVDDFNQDFSSDLLLRRETAPYDLQLRKGDGVGFRAPIVMNVPNRGANWEVAATADFGYDGYADILWRDTATQKLEISRLEGQTQVFVSIPSADHAVDGNWRVVTAGDADVDDDVDLLWYNASSGKIVYWWLDSSFQRVAGGFADPPSAGNANWKVVAGADFGRGPLVQLPNAYGVPDVLWRNATSSKLVVWHMNGAGRRTSGVFTSPDAEAPGFEVVGPR